MRKMFEIHLWFCHNCSVVRVTSTMVKLEENRTCKSLLCHVCDTETMHSPVCLTQGADTLPRQFLSTVLR